MNPQTLLRLGACAAILGGTLRVIAAFIPYASDSASLELLYAVIDLSLVLGLVSIYAREFEVIGWPGLAAFLSAFAGLASIVGPDARAFGVDWYQLGAAVAALGLAALGTALIAAGRLIPAALCWMVVPAIALAAPPAVGQQAAGIMFGLGFLVAGLMRLTPPAAGTG